MHVLHDNCLTDLYLIKAQHFHLNAFVFKFHSAYPFILSFFLNLESSFFGGQSVTINFLNSGKECMQRNQIWLFQQWFENKLNRLL